jgi:hypothetical protein
MEDALHGWIMDYDVQTKQGKKLMGNLKNGVLFIILAYKNKEI